MAGIWRSTNGRQVTVSGTSIEDALHRCIVLASPHGTIQLKPARPGLREFSLDLNEAGSARLQWRLRSVAAGTEVSVSHQVPPYWFGTRMGRPTGNRDLQRKLELLPRALNLKVVVIGGGTGLYTTLLGLRDRVWSLTALISGLPPRGTTPRDPKDELGSLPPDDAGICLVALSSAGATPTVVRDLLQHRMRGGSSAGAHFGPVFLEALYEMRGSRQAALDAAATLLSAQGRIIIASPPASEADIPSGSEPSPAAAALLQADLVVVAPGHLQLDVIRPLSARDVAEAFRSTPGTRVLVTKIMTAERDPSDAPLVSQQLEDLVRATGAEFEVLLANSASFTMRQLAAYAAQGACPVVPDLKVAASRLPVVQTEPLVAPGHLARHDPLRLADALIGIATESVFAPIGTLRALQSA
jgi:2-phospho-L-lactate transferase/gluconeogenesis factor (CofD/UPF0052 family)